MIRRPLSILRFIVVHHSATPSDWSVEDIRRIHLSLGYADIGYHYLITPKGMKVGRPIIYRGAHVLPDKPPYIGIDMNSVSIGLCIIGDFSKNSPSPKLINEAAYGIVRLSKKFNIPISASSVIGHRDVSFTVCPGKDTMPLIYKKLGLEVK